MADEPSSPTRRDLRQVHQTWEYLARTDPFWAVLTQEDKKGGAWDPEEFFATGRAEVDALVEELDGLLPRRERALDFGCGLGRLSQALARHFERVDGVDVAPSMVALATEHDRSDGRCHYHLNPRPDLSLFEDATFDLVYSNITLQHMPPKLARLYMGEFLRVLRPGGLAVFQLPFCRTIPGWSAVARRAYRQTRRTLRRWAPDWVYRSYRRIVAPDEPLPPEPPSKPPGYEMEMYSTSPSRALGSIESVGGRLLEASIWADVGDDRWDSYRYIVQK